MTAYRENDLASVDTSFGVQIHHPRCLECVGAPGSAWLLGCPPAEWLQVMDRRDALIAALQLQWDAVDGIKLDGAQPVCDHIASHVNGGTTIGIRPVIYFASGR